MTIEIRVPQLPESVADASIAAWVVSVGDYVEEDQNLLELETDKVVLEVPAPAAGVLIEIKAEQDATVLGGDLIGIIDETAAASASSEAAAPAAAESTPAASAAPANSDANASPSVRKNDLEKKAAPAKKAAAGTTTVDLSGREERRVPMTRLRAKIAERLIDAQQTAAILTTFNEVDLSQVMRLRKKYQERFTKAHDVKLGFMSFFVKAATEALKRYPEINAKIDDGDIIYQGYYDIGVAVSSERGLVVPVLRNTDTMGNADIEKAIKDFGTRARSGHLELDDLTGGTFSITNGGIFGSMLSTPIINPPQSAILGMHNIQERAMVVDGEIVIRPMMYLALSYDHRLIDGKAAVSFLVKVKELLEDPATLFLEL
ncbi:UNVERIFIED_CONTAM: hypothetical protein GTU68_001020 [Idotea baltica]|nr:hypothetical protein [Idotea baltica]